MALVAAYLKTWRLKLSMAKTTLTISYRTHNNWAINVCLLATPSLATQQPCVALTLTPDIHGELAGSNLLDPLNSLSYQT